MSRSYKKSPYSPLKSHKESKRLANKKFRKRICLDEFMAARPQHKKYSESWDICDYKSRMTREEAIHFYESCKLDPYSSFYFFKRYPTLKSWLKNWDKYYRRK